MFFINKNIHLSTDIEPVRDSEVTVNVKFYFEYEIFDEVRSMDSNYVCSILKRG